MPESRDRLVRQNNIVAEYQSGLRSIGQRGISSYVADDGRRMNQPTFRWGSTPLTGGGLGQHNGGVTHVTRGRGLFGSPVVTRPSGGRRQNTPQTILRRGRGGVNSWAHGVLPSWYRRRPMSDITHMYRAIQRGRERLEIRSSQEPADEVSSPSVAHLEQDLSFVTPKPKLPNTASKTFKSAKLGKVSMMIAEFAYQGGGESENLTPQRRLLNSIDIVEKVVTDELARLKTTPAAKKAERQEKVRTLMSMR